MTTQLSEALRFTRTPQPTLCKPELLPISKSQVYQDTTAHSLQTGFIPYHTDNLFRFTRTPQPTHINPSYYRSVNPKFTRTPQPTHCKQGLPLVAHSLFRFTRIPQPTHVNPQIKPVSSTSPRTAWSQNAQHNFGQKLPIWLTTHAMHTCMPMPYIGVLFSYLLMCPTLPFTDILFTSHRNIYSEYYASLNNNQCAIEQFKQA